MNPQVSNVRRRSGLNRGPSQVWVYDRRTARANLGKLKARFKDVSDYEQLDDRQLQNQLFKLALEDPTDFLIPVAPRQFPRSVARNHAIGRISRVDTILSVTMCDGDGMCPSRGRPRSIRTGKGGLAVSGALD
jgi:hypothetical protein